jgi:hypothetical protein
LWGNYNSDFKAAMTTPPLAEIVTSNPVNAVFKSVGRGEENSVLLTFYTPTLGSATDDWRTLESGSFAWVHSSELSDLPADIASQGQVRDWVLVQIP